ncbi:salicylate carboxymethyltransferase-like isoform X2 [Papaver somniferum]|uniref:salicylate carboxymethyltransferase-like isoform X2 n=1 Tax=Papaver somniferum TaxID=3469 RepID=UPI000E70264B|nr:salicylate carboxymethyltransferase-like isoform X2 [Papaver somniferum]
MDQVIIRNVHMNGGTSETSYSANSSVQKRAILITRPIVEEATLNVLSKSYIFAAKSKLKRTTIGIAELDCASGPNALLVVSHILETIYNKHYRSGSVMPEILVFLNDLPGNDFNTLFKDVGSFCDELRRSNGDGFGPCFVAGIPGTFYGRLFPSDTLHIVHSSYSLQWLSQVPQGIEKSNKGNFYITKSSPPSVITAYLNQFKKDFRVFLECRSEELVNGGRMVLTLVGRSRSDPTSKDCCSFWELLALSAHDMVLQGAIEKEKFDLFNIPNYFPSPEEVKSIILCEGSFTTNQLETFHVNWDGSDPKENANSVTRNKLESSHYAANILRAVSEPLLANQFGEEIMDKLYGRFRERIAEYAAKGKTEFTNLVISMTKMEKDL